MSRRKNSNRGLNAILILILIVLVIAFAIIIKPKDDNNKVSKETDTKEETKEITTEKKEQQEENKKTEETSSNKVETISSSDETQENKNEVTRRGGEVSIELIGDDEVTVSVGDTYKDKGFKATYSDGSDASVEVDVENDVDTSKAGVYTVSYYAGNAVVIRRVTVK